MGRGMSEKLRKSCGYGWYAGIRLVWEGSRGVVVESKTLISGTCVLPEKRGGCATTVQYL